MFKRFFLLFFLFLTFKEVSRLLKTCSMKETTYKLYPDKKWACWVQKVSLVSLRPLNSPRLCLKEHWGFRGEKKLTLPLGQVLNMWYDERRSAIRGVEGDSLWKWKHLFVIHNDDICPEDHILKYRLLDMYVKPHNNGQQISLMFISLSAGSMRVFCDY